MLDRTDLSWSPDGRYLAYVAGGHGFQVNRVWVLRLADGQAHPVTDGRWNDHSPTWSRDSRAVFFVSNRGGSRDLWQQWLSDDGEPEGEARAVTAGVGISHAAMSLDGSRLVYAKGGPVANVWRVPLLEDRRRREILFWEYANGLWVVPAEGGEPRQVMPVGWTPDWSPDGEWIGCRSDIYNSINNLQAHYRWYVTHCL